MLVTIYQTNLPVITFDSSPFVTIGFMLENINKYRGPDAQIQDLYLDAQRTKKADKNSWLLLNTIFYTLSVSSPSVAAP